MPACVCACVGVCVSVCVCAGVCVGVCLDLRRMDVFMILFCLSGCLLKCLLVRMIGSWWSLDLCTVVAIRFGNYCCEMLCFAKFAGSVFEESVNPAISAVRFTLRLWIHWRFSLYANI